VERRAAFDFKVGESTSEVGAMFLTRVLGLGAWMAREQIAKNGLRFWFDAPGNTDPTQCSELGPKLQVRLPAFQLDRSKLDTHVLELAAAAGCEVRRPATVRDIVLATADSAYGELSVTAEGTTERVRAKWIIDASGKATVLGRLRGTVESVESHPTSSMWCRFRGVRDLDDGTLAQQSPCYAQRTWGMRGTGTNHLAGYGWWAWIIPLQGGETSVGITWDRRCYEPPTDGTIPERLRAALAPHAMGAWLMKEAEPVEQDARFYAEIAYRNREVMGAGWACVGDAAGFMDPLYSHGIDFIGNTVYAVHKIVGASLRGEDVAARVRRYSDGYAESYERWFASLYKDKYRYLGDAELMRAAVFLDIASYFIGPVRLVYENTDAELSLLPYNGRPGAMFGKFMALYNRRLAKLAERRRAKGMWGRQNVAHHCVFANSFTPSLEVRKLLWRGLKEWARCEWSTWRARPQPIPAASEARVQASVTQLTEADARS
jgi:flavin-dependent dehydrogenase